MLFDCFKEETPSREATYDPLPSVWYGDDAELLEKMLSFYPRTPPERILDATVNAGRFWEGTTRPVVGMHIDPQFNPDIVADTRDGRKHTTHAANTATGSCFASPRGSFAVLAFAARQAYSIRP